MIDPSISKSDKTAVVPPPVASTPAPILPQPFQGKAPLVDARPEQQPFQDAGRNVTRRLPFAPSFDETMRQGNSNNYAPAFMPFAHPHQPFQVDQGLENLLVFAPPAHVQAYMIQMLYKLGTDMARLEAKLDAWNAKAASSKTAAAPKRKRATKKQVEAAAAAATANENDKNVEQI
ncbi:hypothetical protein MPSEU_000918500 [Mayamaea pseudoterrestris]|nr:hypothetical protein MPSEU_000918500 [Mayamaea pseudoterrestris]